MKARSAKAKGTKLEKWCKDQLERLGLRSRRQPGSGIYQSFPHDIAFHLAGREWIGECKAWKHGWRTGDGALGQADILIIKRNFGEPCVYLPWARFAELVEELHNREKAAGEVA